VELVFGREAGTMPEKEEAKSSSKEVLENPNCELALGWFLKSHTWEQLRGRGLA